MLFPSETLLAARRELVRRMDAGEITGEEAFRQALALDPDDAIALNATAVACAERGEFEEAQRLFWHAIQAMPVLAAPYRGLARLLRQSGGDPALGTAVFWLATRRVVYEEGGSDSRDRLLERMRKECGTGTDEETAEVAIDVLSMGLKDEPEHVTTLLEPYRLVQDVIDYPEEGMDRSVVDRILALDRVAVPLLIGILRGDAHCQWDDPDTICAALALLGEIGDPATVSAISEFLQDPDVAVSEAAAWSLHRLTEAHPALNARSPELPEGLEELDVYTFCCLPPDFEDDFEEEDDDLVPQTFVDLNPKPGRNEPCWCGSGKKYKKCHLEADQRC